MSLARRARRARDTASRRTAAGLGLQLRQHQLLALGGLQQLEWRRTAERKVRAVQITPPRLGGSEQLGPKGGDPAEAQRLFALGAGQSVIEFLPGGFDAQIEVGQRLGE